MGIFTIPIGSIVYHVNNITTVFDKTGNQFLVTDDSEVGRIHTFKGSHPVT
jgi:hypothetical protein